MKIKGRRISTLSLVPVGYGDPELDAWVFSLARRHPAVDLSREFDAGILVMFLIVVLTGIQIVRTERNELV
jgi:hypothetical protein